MLVSKASITTPATPQQVLPPQPQRVAPNTQSGNSSRVAAHVPRLILRPMGTLVQVPSTSSERKVSTPVGSIHPSLGKHKLTPSGTTHMLYPVNSPLLNQTREDDDEHRPPPNKRPFLP